MNNKQRVNLIACQRNLKISIAVPIQQRQVGSIADYDPLNGNWGTVGSSRAAEKIGAIIFISNKYTFPVLAYSFLCFVFPTVNYFIATVLRTRRLIKCYYID